MRQVRALAAMLPLGVLLGGCSDGAVAPPPPPPETPEPPPVVDLVEGQRLFVSEPFGGNSRTCVTCHTRENGTITLEDVAHRLAANMNDELFLHDGLDDGMAGTSRIAAHATIRVELELPPYVTLADNPAQRRIVVNRGVPTTLNAPALDGRGLAALMLDLRDADLQQQAFGAIRAHAQGTVEPTREQLDNIAAFQQADERFFSSAALRAFATSGGPPPDLPEGRTDSERRGRLFFVDAAMTPGSKEGACAICHSGPNLNEMSQSGAAAIPGARGTAGAKFGDVRVAQTNSNQNPTFHFRVSGPGGVVISVRLADPGILLTERSASAQLSEFIPAGTHPAEFAGFFKTPSLWAIGRTAPYFHDNSAKTLREVVDHYADVFFEHEVIAGGKIILTEQDRQDIVAFLERL
jgi:cytochrome c peroxidase